MLLSVVERKTVLENLDLVLLALDEITDSGVILETEPQVIASRVTMRGADADVPLAEQTFSQALALAKVFLMAELCIISSVLTNTWLLYRNNLREACSSRLLISEPDSKQCLQIMQADKIIASVNGHISCDTDCIHAGETHLLLACMQLLFLR